MRPQDVRAARRRRDLAALALIAAGTIGLFAVAYQLDPLLGWGGLALSALVVGILLGIGQ
ncbi:hypothetical protein [Nonomuraea dietziae]|uniref:hypothetical protein n=1 Tax=Nonomuraea dietziae TaxID=65515 RepID=UPI0033EBC133